jgi:lysophospholipase L1-like esterase
MVPASERMPSDLFYGEYHGHRVEHLELLHKALGARPRVWLVGDSSLDNKYWLPRTVTAPAINGYEALLDPPFAPRDVCYALNERIGSDAVAINCAVEESLLRGRAYRPLPQDEFVRDNLSEHDTIVLSVGGNDVASKPTMRTLFNIFKAVLLNSEQSIKSSNGGWGIRYLEHMFRDETQRFVEQLTSRTRPKRVIVCMIYHPDETPTDSWASTLLKYVQYDSAPSKLQAVIEALYDRGTTTIRVDGTEIVPCPLFRAMNGKDTSLYVDRVEPSEKGGQVIAELLSSLISPP